MVETIERALLVTPMLTLVAMVVALGVSIVVGEWLSATLVVCLIALNVTVFADLLRRDFV